MSNEYPKTETTDFLGNQAVAGQVVILGNGKSSLRIGIFIRQNKNSSSVAVHDLYQIYKSQGSKRYSTTQAKDFFIIKDPVANLNSAHIRMALELVEDIKKDGNLLPKDFDVGITWGLTSDELEK